LERWRTTNTSTPTPPIADVFYWANPLSLGKNVVTVDDGQGNTDGMTVYYLGTGTTLPADGSARSQT